jgi:hypothetical protein
MMPKQKPTLQERFERLPPELQRVVETLVDALSEQSARQKHGVPSFDWAGALRDAGETLNSVDLQHEVLRDRAED